MALPAALYLNSTAIERIGAFLSQNGHTKTRLAQWLHTSDRHLRNFLAGHHPIGNGRLSRLLELTNTDIATLTGESLAGYYLSESAANLVQTALKSADLGALAESLGVDSARLRNWANRYTAAEEEQLQALLAALNIPHAGNIEYADQPPLAAPTNIEEAERSSTRMREIIVGLSVAVLAVQSQPLAQPIDAQKVESLLRAMNLPEKHAQVFRHDTSVGRNYYAEIVIEGAADTYKLTYMNGLQPVDYGEVRVQGGKVVAYNTFTRHMDVRPHKGSVRIATWFGEGDCLFVIRADKPFQIRMGRKLNLTEAASANDVAVFWK